MACSPGSFGCPTVSWTNAVWYAVKYSVSIDQIHTDDKPSDCDWGRAPLGNKACHFKAVVTAYNAAVAVREVDTTTHLPLHYDQLMSERRVLCLKSALRLERRGEQGQEEAEQRDHRR